MRLAQWTWTDWTARLVEEAGLRHSAVRSRAMKEAGGNLANERSGWASVFPVFEAATVDEIVGSLEVFIRDATPEQIRAWRGSVPSLKSGCSKILAIEPAAIQYGAILEYRMPDGAHRVDAVLLVSGAVLVLELKGDGNWQPEYAEQAADYARRLFWYHSLCGTENVRVHTIVVSYGTRGAEFAGEWHTLTNIENLGDVVRRFDRRGEAVPIPVAMFIAPEVCQPSPSLVQAARRFFADHELPHIKRIDDITSAAVGRLVQEIRTAHHTKKRKLILVSGVPGAGKTYVGLKIAHEKFLDDLAEPLASGEKPTAPAVFLSGNGPLVEVLQYELKQAGGGGRVFVRGIKDFVERYSKKKSGPPPHHVLIFDEAQRAWDAEKVRASHRDESALSEPETFVRFAERVPQWSVVMGLIGDGQEIHSGEEAGIVLWAEAVATSAEQWEVVGPNRFRDIFTSHGVGFAGYDELHLARSVRFNFAEGLSDWAAGVVSGETVVSELSEIATRLRSQGYQLRVTRDLARAKEFLWAKYRESPDARFGLVVSSRDKALRDFGVVPSDGRFFRPGPWYSDPESSPSSCRRLQDTITEFSAQGLELDHTLLVWGGDFVLKSGIWDSSAAKKYLAKSRIRNPLQLRRNAYRVLLTRGREGVLICLPRGLTTLDETYDFLISAGCEPLA